MSYLLTYTPSFCAVIFIHGSTGLCVLSTWVRDRTIPEKKLRAKATSFLSGATMGCISCSSMERRGTTCAFPVCERTKCLTRVVRYLLVSNTVEARSPCSCSGSRRRASKLTWCTAVVFGHGESLQSFVGDDLDCFDDEPNQSSGRCNTGSYGTGRCLRLLTWRLQGSVVLLTSGKPAME